MTHAVVNKQQTRRLRSIVEVVNVNPDGIAVTNTPFIWNPQDDKFYFKKDSKVFSKIALKFGLSQQEIQLEFDRRTRLLFELFKRQINNFEEIGKIINDYYKNPEQVLERFNIK